MTFPAAVGDILGDGEFTAAADAVLNLALDEASPDETASDEVPAAPVSATATGALSSGVRPKIAARSAMAATTAASKALRLLALLLERGAALASS